MNSIATTFIERQYDFYTALIQHLQLSLSALFIAIVIALPLGVLVARRKGIAEVLIQITGIMQTLPSLAVLGLMIPIFGIGSLPALTALVIYALFPILQNTITGIQEIDPSHQEAGEALGMNRPEKLKNYEIPLALPVITAGIRTAAVMIIGTATLAALIGAGGLGTFILLGIDRNDSALILIGALASAFLAIVFNFILRFMEHRSLRHIACFLGTLALILITSFVPFSGRHDKIVIAGKLGPEPEILINMYKELIEHHTNLEVELKPNFGKTTFLYEALKSGDIDMYPEFTGTVTTTLLQQKPPASTDARTVYEQGRDGIYSQDRLIYLEPTAYENTYAVAVSETYAAAHSLHTISDLTRVSNSAVAGFTLEFADRRDGNRGLQSLYGLHLNVKTMEPALRYEAIRNGAIQITDAYSTDSELIQYHLVVLKDDKHLFPPYQGAPLIREETLEAHPELRDVLNKLSGNITEEEMQQMNYDVRVNGRSAHDVAAEYVKNHGLI